MTVDPFLLELLADPVDHEPLLYIASADVLVNPRRRVVYVVTDGIPVLVPSEARELDDEELSRWTADPDGRWTGRSSD